MCDVCDISIHLHIVLRKRTIKILYKVWVNIYTTTSHFKTKLNCWWYIDLPTANDWNFDSVWDSCTISFYINISKFKFLRRSHIIIVSLLIHDTSTFCIGTCVQLMRQSMAHEEVMVKLDDADSRFLHCGAFWSFSM